MGGIALSPEKVLEKKMLMLKRKKEGRELTIARKNTRRTIARNGGRF